MTKFDEERFNSQGTTRVTPNSIFDPLDEEFGFTLDVAADKFNSKCEKFFTESDNSLVQDWSNDVCWMNPPFGRQIKLFVEKAYKESRKGAIVVCLLPVRSNTGWWHDYCMKGEIRFIRGRPKFEGYKYGLPWPLAIVVFSAIGK